MRIDGADVELRLTKSTHESGRQNKGYRFTETYVGRGVRVRVTYVITRPSPPGEEVTEYSATIHVTKGQRTGAVRVVGDCGC